jgi:hypothetical protein
MKLFSTHFTNNFAAKNMLSMNSIANWEGNSHTKKYSYPWTPVKGKGRRGQGKGRDGRAEGTLYPSV